MSDKYYIFREPAIFDELKALLLLRYKVFRESRLEKFVAENEACIDLDCYDLYSRHFGLYEHDGDSSRPVGYIRMVTDEEGTFRDKLFELAKSIPSIYEKVNRIPKEPFPLMNYFPEADIVKDFYHEVKFRGENIVEASRLSLDQSVRGLKTATFFIAAISAAFIIHGADEAIMTCVHRCAGKTNVRANESPSFGDLFERAWSFSRCSATFAERTTLRGTRVYPRSVPQTVLSDARSAERMSAEQQRGFYSQFGFKQFDGTGECYVDYVNYHDVCLNGFAKRLPEPMKEKVYKMAEVYKRFGRICYDPSNPNNYYAPLVSYIKSKPVFAPAVESDSKSDVYVEKEITESEKCICEMHSTALPSVYETDSTATIKAA